MLHMYSAGKTETHKEQGWEYPEWHTTTKTFTPCVYRMEG